MTRHLAVPWPDAGAFAGRAAGTPVRLLAVSDVPDPALEHPENRRRLGDVDLVVGAGDLEPDYLSFLADAFVAPLVYVRGNHDAGGAWTAALTRSGPLPDALPDSSVRQNAGVDFVGLSWPSPGVRGRPPEGAAWRQVVPLVIRSLANGRRPLVVVSHVPPRGVGDVPEDPFHIGFAAYRWIAEHVRPRLWLHGHTHPAAQTQPWQSAIADTTVINVTGAVLIELTPPGGAELAHAASASSM